MEKQLVTFFVLAGFWNQSEHVALGKRLQESRFSRILKGYYLPFFHFALSIATGYVMLFKLPGLVVRGSTLASPGVKMEGISKLSISDITSYISTLLVAFRFVTTAWSGIVA
jgi:hypothetical protein